MKSLIYNNPGIGRSSTGHSMAVTMTTVNMSIWIYKLNEQFVESKIELIKYF